MVVVKDCKSGTSVVRTAIEDRKGGGEMCEDRSEIFFGRGERLCLGQQSLDLIGEERETTYITSAGFHICEDG